MTLSEIYSQLKAVLPEHDARYLLKYRTGKDWSDLMANPDMAVPVEQADQMTQDMTRLQDGEPLSRILGEREFWGLQFFLNADTLDPRPDTEVLVGRALKHFANNPPENLLDIGTGTGCIAIALLTEWPQTTAVVTDLSLGALNCARANAKNLGVESRIKFVNTSWADSLDTKFDCIVSNPPYIRNAEISNLDDNVKNFDPLLALDGGEDGLQAYKKIFSFLLCVLKTQGRAFFEIGYDQQEEIERLSKEYRIRIEGVYPDYAGIPRVVDISCGDK